MSDSDQDDHVQEKSAMTSEQRKSKYRDLLDQVEILQENEETGFETTETLDEIIENANLLFKDSNIKERIKHTDEVLLDAKVVATASDVLLHITESIDCTLDTYEHVDLARKINTQLLSNSDDPDETDYTQLAKIAYTALQNPPSFSFIYGELGNSNVEAKPVKERKPSTQKTKGTQAAKREPEKVTETNKEEDSVDDTVKFLQWALNHGCEENGKNKLNYLNFIIDPDSFSTTIENMFHFSFLIRDGRAKIHVDKDGEILVIPVSHHDSKKAKKKGVEYKQSIISIDVDQWQEIVKTLKIKKSFLSKWKSKWDARKEDEVF